MPLYVWLKNKDASDMRVKALVLMCVSQLTQTDYRNAAVSIEANPVSSLLMGGLISKPCGAKLPPVVHGSPKMCPGITVHNV